MGHTKIRLLLLNNIEERSLFVESYSELILGDAVGPLLDQFRQPAGRPLSGGGTPERNLDPADVFGSAVGQRA